MLETGEHLDILFAFTSKGTQRGMEVGRLRAGVIDFVAQGNIGEQCAGVVDLVHGKAKGLGQAVAVALEGGTVESRVVVRKDRARWGHGQRGHSLIAAAHEQAGVIPAHGGVQREQPSHAVIAAEAERGGGGSSRAEAQAEQRGRRHGEVAPHGAGGS